MRVLMIGSDPDVLSPATSTGKRIEEYRKVLGGLEVLVVEGSVRGLISAFLKGRESLQRKSVDVITAQSPEHWVLAWLFSYFFDTPWQAQIHTDIFSPYFWQESLLNKIRVLMAKFLLPKADAIRVVSERIKNSLTNNLQLTTNNIAVLPIFVDIKKIQSAKVKVDLRKKYPEYDFIILMASRLTKEKNIGLAIEAMKDVVKKHPKALLLIVGDGPEKSNLQLEQNVKFESAVDAQTLFSYYKTADLFLLTSNYEGYGRTIIEAMAAGCPVVMTDVGLAGELLVDDLDGLVVPVGDKAALAEAIQELIQNKEKREGLVTESQKIINSLPEKKEYLDSYKNSLNL